MIETFLRSWRQQEKRKEGKSATHYLSWSTNKIRIQRSIQNLFAKTRNGESWLDWITISTNLPSVLCWWNRYIYEESEKLLNSLCSIGSTLKAEAWGAQYSSHDPAGDSRTSITYSEGWRSMSLSWDPDPDAFKLVTGKWISLAAGQ